MNFKIVFCLAVILAISFSEVECKGKGKGGKGKGHKHKCLGEDLNFGEDNIKLWKECHEESKEKEEQEKADEESGESGEGKKKPHDPCMMDCIYRKAKLLDSEDKLDGDKMDAAIKKIYPEKAHKDLLAADKKCREEAPEKWLKEDNCSSSKAYVKCHFKASRKICNKKDKKEKKEETEEE